MKTCKYENKCISLCVTKVREDSLDYGKSDTAIHGVAAIRASLLDYEDMRGGSVPDDYARRLPEMDISKEAAV